MGLAAAASVGAVALATPVLSVARVVVQPQAGHPLDDAVRRQVLAATSRFVGEPMLRTDPRSVAATVEALPMVAGVGVSRRWPRAIVVTVRERAAVIAATSPSSAGIASEKGSASAAGWTLVDPTGTAIASADQPGPGVVPAVVGDADYRRAAAVVAALDSEVLARVAVVTVADDSVVVGLRGAGTAASGQVDLSFGGADDLAAKQAAARALLHAGFLETTDREDAVVIDLRAPDTPVRVPRSRASLPTSGARRTIDGHLSRSSGALP